MSFVKQFIHKRVALAIIVAISGSTVAFAEEVVKDKSFEEIEKIVVTARGRTETLQQIPDSVTVFNAEDIKAARITSIKDFSALTPNLNVSNNFRSGLNFVTVRGLITPQVGEAPIAYVVDGITVPNLEFINQGLHDIERIEVLRGPQGALYGKMLLAVQLTLLQNKLQTILKAVFKHRLEKVTIKS
ncbi:TonB-dependent receptor plug domain-containing protein [Pseudocolwellia sp. HL-MZ19]|uniref:TonB-dependent receptor plug domain-containing protein n=1 Tax=Pseudocolwellia sp. HL-MZ19 TaxID=3400846 RepID=UPI003CF5994B